MGTLIENVATRASHAHGPFARGALRLSDMAAKACLEGAGRRASELDLLVNAGLYKEHSMAEPALASIIQEDIGANPGHPPRHDRHGTFSFDVMNGGCGALSALHLVDAFVAGGTAQLGLVVAGDSDPEPGVSRGFPFGATSGAVLLRRGAAGAGFTRFEFRTFPEDADLFVSTLGWDEALGRNVLEVRESPAFAARCVERAIEATPAFLARAGVDARDVDLLLASPYPPAFADALARALGVSADRVPAVPTDLARAHTAGVIAALEAAFASGAFQRARRVLFVTAGAGVTFGAALYRR